MRNNIWAALGLTALASSGAAYWLFSTADWRRAASDLELEVGMARRHGIPFSEKDLAGNEDVPDKDNAALSLLQAIESLRQVDEGHTSFRDYVGMCYRDPLPVKELSAAIAPFEGTLHLAHEAAQLPRCQFRRNYDRGPLLQTIDLANARNLVRLLTIQADLASVRGDVRTCLQSLNDANAISHDLTADRVFITLASAETTKNLVIRGVWRCLTRLKDNPAGLLGLQKLMHAMPQAPDLRQALRAEAYYHINLIRNLVPAGEESEIEKRIDPPIDLGRMQRAGLPSGLRERAYLARSLAVWNRVFSDIGTSERAIFAVDKIINDEYVRISNTAESTERLNRVLVAAEVGQMEPFIEIEAMQQATVGLADVLVFRVTHDRLPRNLAEAGVTAIDPCSGGPLKLRIDGLRVRVYSIGPNGKDDGGRPPTDFPLIVGKDPGDEVAQYPFVNPF